MCDACSLIKRRITTVSGRAAAAALRDAPRDASTRLARVVSPRGGGGQRRVGGREEREEEEREEGGREKAEKEEEFSRESQSRRGESQ